MIKIYLVLTGLILFGFSCTTAPIEKPIEEQKSLLPIDNEDFDLFYKHFHTDSIFQLSRITFPLDGYYIGENYNPDEKKSDFHWTKSNWEIHEIIEDNGDFKIDLQKSDSLIVETIYIPNSGFEIIRKFKLIKKEWFLVFYGEQDL